jgi:hypothetical protein
MFKVQYIVLSHSVQAGTLVMIARPLLFEWKFVEMASVLNQSNVMIVIILMEMDVQVNAK